MTTAKFDPPARQNDFIKTRYSTHCLERATAADTVALVLAGLFD